jgi:hypothetical protein
MKCSSFKKNIAEAKPKYYHSAIQGPASALRCEVLACYSRGGLPSLLPILELITYPSSGVHTFNAAWTALHTSQRRIHVLCKWPQDIPSSLLALGTWS